MGKLIAIVQLVDAVDVAMTNYAIANGATVYSTGIEINRSVGFMALKVTENKSGGAGDIAIAAEYSDDNSNWDTVYTSNMAGTITAEGNIVTGLQNVTRRIVFTARLGKYVRFKFVASAASQITASVIYQGAT